ncbi:MAG: site-2 protease family protein [Deltaproteobacteria bacterium]|nr:site-2 protease family protein [Nannocystaceae bacterium]
MKGSWKIGRIAGVDAFVHWSFGLLIAWAGWSAWSGAGSLLAVALGIAFLLAVFGSVLLHELGHALAARGYGVRTHSILLTPIGGIANLEGMPSAPRAELAIALAGPAVNVVIAASLALLLAMFGNGFGLVEGLVSGLMWANVTLAAFNLIPAFPMDGGRALRALLATRMGKHSATAIAVKLGKAVAIAMAIIGFFTNPMLVLVAVFVWIAGSSEARAISADVPGSWSSDVYARRDTAAWWDERYDEVDRWNRPRSNPPSVVLINGRLFYR